MGTEVEDDFFNRMFSLLSSLYHDNTRQKLDDKSEPDESQQRLKCVYTHLRVQLDEARICQNVKISKNEIDRRILCW